MKRLLKVVFWVIFGVVYAMPYAFAANGIFDNNVVGQISYAPSYAPDSMFCTIAFSKPGGVYQESFPLSIGCNEKSIQIRYTLNGSVPTAKSLLYTHPLSLDRSLYSSSHIYKIPNAIPQYQSPIPDAVEHAIVVRAAAFDSDGRRCSEVITATYIIAPLMCRDITLPIVSLCVDSVDLFDADNGIFVPGNSFDSAKPDATGNYYLKGRAYEKEGHVEFFDGATMLAQPCGVRAHGDRGRRYTQKGLSLYARKEYGQKKFDPIFEEDGLKTKRLVLKPFACAWTPMGFQDLFCQKMAKQFHTFGSLNARPVVLFLNGEYWGIYFLEEKPDERYLQDHYGVDKDYVQLVRDWAGHDKDMVVDTAFAAMMRWLLTADMSDDKQYAQLSKMVDIASFTDYVLFETFIGNRDWPANNMRCWSDDGSPWRFVFFDGDAIRTQHFDYVGNALYEQDDKTWPTNAQATLLLRKLMQNAQYRALFVQRLDAMRQHFSFTARAEMRQLFEQAASSIESEIPYQSERFGFPKNSRAWRQAVRQQRRYWRNRGDEVQQAWKQALNERYGESFPIRRLGWRWSFIIIAGMVVLVTAVAQVKRRIKK